MDNFEFYDWNKTLSYDAETTMVVGERGIGKTYGMRLQHINDYIERGHRFLQLCRHKNQLDSFVADFFTKQQTDGYFQDYVFKTDTKRAYIAEKSDKPKWELFGYFNSLSQAQMIKSNSNTYNKVKRIVLDEAIIDKRIDKVHNYYQNEIGVMASIVDSVSRQRPGVKGIEPRLYLMGNAADLMNPYFARFKIYEPKHGYTWHDKKRMLLHYTDNKDYGKAKANDTVAGHLLQGTVDELISSNNEFVFGTADYVEEKPKHARFYMGLVYKSEKFGIWIDEINGYYYITQKIPNNATPIYALTTEDNRVNYIMAGKANKALKGFMNFYYYDMLRFQNVGVKQKFVDILDLFGVR